MAQLQRAAQSVRTAAWLAPARPAYAAGVRAALATVIPLVVGQAVGSAGGTWMSLAGFNGALADRGGPRSGRAATLVTLTLSVAVALFAGTLGGATMWTAIPLAALVAFLCSLARVYGTTGASIGGATLASFAIALGIPSLSFVEALSRAGFAIAGGCWFMLIALVIWPLRPHETARIAVAAAFRALADYADASRATRGVPKSVVGHVEPTAAGSVRTALENARARLGELLRGRGGETGPGRGLLALNEIADQLFGHVAALAEVIESIPVGGRDEGELRAIDDMLHAVATTLRSLADAIRAVQNPPAIPLEWSSSTARLDADAATIVDRMHQFTATAIGLAMALSSGEQARLPEAVEAEVAMETEDTSRLAPLYAAWTLDSVVMRHALRAAIVVSFIVTLTHVLGIARGYWVTITAIVILQPYIGATSTKALQRVLGTVLGGVITALLGAAFHDPRAILALTFVLSGVCVALLPVNYAAYSMFLTPTFVLLAEANAGDWHLAAVRIVDTLIGAGIAIVGARLLWPSPELTRLPGYLSAAVRANRDYLRVVADRIGDRGAQASATIRHARRQAGLAIVNAEESFQRVLGEHVGAPETLEPTMTLLAITRRVIAAIAALALARHAGSVPLPSIDAFVRRAERIFDDLTRAIDEREAPAPLPVDASVAQFGPDTPMLLRARLSRLDRQLRTLHDVVVRWQLADSALES